MIIELAALTLGIAFAVFAVTLGGLFLVTWVLRALDDSDGPDDGQPGPGRGGGRRRPDPPSTPGGEPAWWPAFERDLADYVKGRLHPSA